MTRSVGTLKPGFSLLETVITIGVIALLLAIALPVLGGARGIARSAAALSALRQHATVFASYTNEHRGIYPVLASPLGPQEPAATQGYSYFSMSEYWPVAMASRYYNSPPYADIFYDPRVKRAEIIKSLRPTEYRYSCTFFARPDYWDEQTRAGQSQLGAVRVDEVTRPSAKALLVLPGPMPTGSDRGLRMALADGSATAPDPARREPGVRSGDGKGRWPDVGALHYNDSIWGLHTLRGVRGTDLR